MKRILIIAACAALFFALPSAASAYYVIELENGRQIVASVYWEEGSMIMFQYRDGTVGVFKDHVRNISESFLPLPEEEVFTPAAAKPVAEKVVRLEKVALTVPMEKAVKKEEKFFAQDFRGLRERFTQVMSMSSEDLLAFSKDIMELRDKILSVREGDQYSDEFMSMYSMADTVEETLKERQKYGFNY
ncbi:MAG: hypothetical protein KKA60_06815 [Proteobacteria bacterium]|nr:hypothetical protein [Pseudomonadota bacterium]